MNQNMPRTVGVVSLGCSKNRVDTEVMLGQLKNLDIEPVSDPAEAEMIVVNTCGFIESAKEESIDAILEMARYKGNGRLKLLMVTGCLSQRYGDQLKEELSEVDLFLGVSEYGRLEEAIQSALSGQRPLLTGEGARFFESPRVLTTPSHSAYIKISDGCDNRCAYCAIPLIRGGYRSRPYAEIIAECESLLARGAKELTLIAQDTSRYGNDFPEKTLLLPRLLREISALNGLHWLRVLYCYPDTVTDELLDEIAGNPKICSYLDLPLQHFDRRMLEAMNRRGTPEDIEALIEGCKRRGIAVRTTMIVGFPGETEAQFEELLRFVKRARFDRLGAFPYSPEEGTAAAEMEGQLPEEVKLSRLDQLMMLQQGISLQHNQARMDQVCEVLVEGFEEGAYTGRSALEAPEVDGAFRFTAQRALHPGEFVRVRVTGFDAYDLQGEAVL